METLKKGTEVDLEIESLAFGGRGIARINGFVIFVEGALPGQTVRAKIIKKRKAHAEARTSTVLQSSPLEQEPRCPHFFECGGCRFQHLDYAAQLEYKHQQVVDSLERLGGFTAPEVAEILPSPDAFYYRNKMEFSFGRQRWLTQNEIEQDEIIKPKDFALGLHVKGRFDKILDLDACFLQSPLSADILNETKTFVHESGVPAYSTADHSGFWRHLVIREGKNTGETMVNIVTARIKKFEAVTNQLAAQLMATFPSITTIVHTINSKKAQVAFGDEVRVLSGPGTIQEKIGEHVFRISAHSFFQTNTKGAEMLYRKVADFADLQGDETIFDLYSGAGTISIFLANKAKNVVGFEVVEDAVADAQANCDLNKITNCTFVAGDLKETLKAESTGSPDVIVIDPPRAGMHGDVLATVLELNPQKIVYVSCNPTTFSRDARVLCQSQYQLQAVQPVDMFPMTPHIETVSLLTKKSLT